MARLAWLLACSQGQGRSKRTDSCITTWFHRRLCSRKNEGVHCLLRAHLERRWRKKGKGSGVAMQRRISKQTGMRCALLQSRRNIITSFADNDETLNPGNVATVPTSFAKASNTGMRGEKEAGLVEDAGDGTPPEWGIIPRACNPRDCKQRAGLNDEVSRKDEAVERRLIRFGDGAKNQRRGPCTVPDTDNLLKG
ncbi:hypothetical protein DFH09DRAFT_1110494 [Mycena vulgaris]|nr:hypothetical protein DFH09DRAFT_1110494 [Mycena vulgaris]